MSEINFHFDREWLVGTMAVLLKDTTEVRWSREAKKALAWAAYENVPDHHPAKLIEEMIRLCYAWEKDQFERSEFLRKAA